MSRLLIFLSGIFCAAAIVLAFHTGYTLFTTGHLERCLIRVEDAATGARLARAESYCRELGWLGCLAVSILLFQVGSRIDENRHI